MFKLPTVKSALGLFVSAVISSQSMAEPVRHIDLPAGELSVALDALSKQSEVEIVYRRDQLKGVKTQGINGTLSAEQAVRKLLEGTTFRLSLDANSGAMLIAPNGVQSSATATEVKEGNTIRLAWTDAQSPDLRGSDASSSQQPESSDQPSRLEEIVVTARKTSERLQDVPISVTAISGAQLKERGAIDLKDVLGSVPGLAYQGLDRGFSNYNIRGVTSLVTTPTVGIYLDDISMITAATFSGAFDPVLFDIERLEVLKGPQGTLYGGSAMGGAIKYVSARPNLSALSSSVAVRGATVAHGSESYGAEGIVNVPIVPEVLALRAGISYLHEGGFIDNIANANIEDGRNSSTPSPVYTPVTMPSLSTRNREDRNFSNSYVGRLSLLWHPDASWSIRPAVFFQDSKLADESSFLTNLPGLSSSTRLPGPSKDRAGIYSLDITKEWDQVEVTSLTSYFDRKQVWERDFSFFIAGITGGFNSPLFPFTSVAHYPNRIKTFSEELRISSAGSDARLRWVGGLYYSTQDQRFLPVVHTYGADTLMTAIFGSLYNPATDVAYIADVKTQIDQSAAFGEATYAVTEALDFTVGVRLFQIKQDVVDSSDGPFNNGPTFQQGSSDESGVNPKVGLAYKVAEDHLLYVSATKGFRPGGPNIKPVSRVLCAADLAALGLTDKPAAYEADNLWTYEAGSKNEFGAGRLMMNGSVFYSDWKDIQQNIRLSGCGLDFNYNAGVARIQGVEFETRYNVTPAFQVGGNATYTDAQITEVAQGASLPIQAGDQIQAVPKWMASVYGRYSIPLNPTWNLGLRADYQYRARQRNNFNGERSVLFSDGVRVPFPNEGEFQESYEVVNTYASLENGATTVRLSVNNLLDARPYFSLNPEFASQASTIRPRTIGLEVLRQF